MGWGPAKRNTHKNSLMSCTIPTPADQYLWAAQGLLLKGGDDEGEEAIDAHLGSAGCTL